ncbi:MAG: hypothetical protein JKY37_22805 [Nannocystaceae bacterium]|nr:hypothetical protein [Nannocystaceae bacterium]
MTPPLTANPTVRKHVAPPRVLRPTLATPRAHDRALAGRDADALDLGLRRLGDGYAYSGTDAERFKATILRDGHVVFDVESEVQVKLDGICLVAICRQTKAARRLTRRHRRRGSRAALTIAALLAEAAAGSVTVGARHYGQPATGPIEGSQILGRKPYPLVTATGRYGYLPSPSRAMNDFMDRTHELRLQMARSAALQDIVAALARLQRTLDRLWSSDKLTPTQQRAMVLALWGDVDQRPPHADAVLAETLDGQLEVKRRAAAQASRTLILESTRLHLPVGAMGAFTAAELSVFNTREGAGVPFRPNASPILSP